MGPMKFENIIIGAGIIVLLIAVAGTACSWFMPSCAQENTCNIRTTCGAGGKCVPTDAGARP